MTCLQSTTPSPRAPLYPAEKICSLALTARCDFCVGADNSNTWTPLVHYNTIWENFITQLVVHCHRISSSFWNTFTCEYFRFLGYLYEQVISRNIKWILWWGLYDVNDTCDLSNLFIFSLAYLTKIEIETTRAVFKWLSKNQNQSNYSDQSQHEQTALWTNHSS